MMLNKKFEIVEDDVKFFKKHGFLVLRKFFSKKTTEHMSSIAGNGVGAPQNNYGSGFSKLGYDLGNDDTYLLDLMQDERFAAALRALTDQNVFFTQGLGFELEKEKSSGFPWHVGTQSFGFQRQIDAGYTIWSPLCEIDPKKQRGGMAYVSKDILSGEFIYQHILLLPEYIKALQESGNSLDFEQFSKLKNSVLNSGEMDALLNHHAVEDAFEVGDAIIFDKYVLHRSVRLGEGPIRSRMAYALRFCATDAIYDKTRVDALRFPREAFNYDVGSTFNDDVASQDGEPIYRSSYFDKTRAKRTIGAGETSLEKT